MNAGHLLRRAAPWAALSAVACLALATPAGASAAIASAATATTTTTTTTTTTSTTTTTTTTTNAPKPPTASTGAATSVSFASATLGGTVNPNGTSTTYFFQYGTSTAYGTQTSAASAGVGTGDVAVSAAVSGLLPSKTYHFRLVAMSPAGTVDGADQTFTTTATPPPSLSTGAARSVTSNAAIVTATIDPHGVPTTFQFQYGRTAGYGSHSSTQSAGSAVTNVAVSAALGGLSPSATYHYRVIATSAGGTVAGSDRTFTTGRRSVASASTGSALQITAATAVLSGTVYPNGNPALYYFQYGTSTAYTARTPTQSAGSGRSGVHVLAGVTGLAAATRYHFRLVVVSGAGTAAGRDNSFTTSSIPLSLVASVTPNPVGVDGAATISGSLTGTAAAGRQVALVSTPFPYTAPFTQVGNAQVIGPGGGFAFAVTSLRQNTEYRVVTVGSPSASSGPLLERVAVRVSFGANARRTRRGLLIRVHGDIAPAAGDVVVYLEKVVRGRWRPTTRLRVSPLNANLLFYRRTLRVARGGRYRVIVRVTDGQRVGAVSRSLFIRRPRH